MTRPLALALCVTACVVLGGCGRYGKPVRTPPEVEAVQPDPDARPAASDGEEEGDP
jgi:hypothetical protein